MSGARDYFLAVSLANGRLDRFAHLARGVKGGVVVLHALVIAAALNFPVTLAVARLSPWEFYERLYGKADFPALVTQTLPPGDAAALGEALPGDGAAAEPDTAAAEALETLRETFNLALYQGGWGARVLLPALGFLFLLVVILLGGFYVAAAYLLGVSRLAAAFVPLPDRLRLLVLSSTLPAAGAALLGLWLPTLHLVAFFLAESVLAFVVARED